jgi:O-antigen/teichoic acid export membrane protein
LLTPFLIRALGDTGYGAWILVGSISSYFWLLDFGLGSSVTKFVSELHATCDRARLNAVVASSVALLGVVGLVSLAASWVVAGYADSLFLLTAELAPDVRTMIVLTGVTALFSFPLGVYGGVLRGYQRYDLLNLMVVVSTIANAVLSVAVVYLGFGLVGLTLVGLVTNLIVGVGRLLLARQYDPGLELWPTSVNLSVLREITNFSAWVFVINVATQVVYRTSPIIIAALLGVSLVTPFALASLLVQYVKRFVDPILAVLLPAYAELSAVEDTANVRRLFMEGSRAVGAIAMPMSLGLVLLGRSFIRLWVGPDYEGSGDLLVLLVPPMMLSFLVATGDKLLWAQGKIRVNSYVAIADTALNLGLSVGLALWLGLPGIALATLLSVGLTNGLWLLPYICRECGVPISEYVGRVLAPILIPAIPTTVLVLALMRVFPLTGYPQFLVVAAICTLTYWASFAVVSGREERRRWLSTLRTAMPARAAA